MIYLSVGTFREGFDRLVKIVDEICQKNKLNCFAQIGHGKYIPNYIKYKKFLTNKNHLHYMKKSNLLILHGGMGVISESISLKKKFIVFPRTKQEASHDQEVAIKLLKKKINFSISKNKYNLENQIMKHLKKKMILDFNLKKSNIPILIKEYLKNIKIDD